MNQRRRRATLKDVAELAGTSVATASRVLTGSGFVAPETRTRILDATKALHYQPNLRARALRQQSSHSIGLIIPNLLNAYYTALADAISQILADRGYHLLLAATRDEPEAERAVLHDMVGQDVDGFVWVPTAPDRSALDYLESQDIPTVAIVRRVPGDAIDTVTFEDYAGSYAATRHLLMLGHRQIAYLGGDVKHSSNHARWQGFLAAMHDFGATVDERLVKLGVSRGTWSSVATQNLLKMSGPPTAIFAASNTLVPGVLKTLHSFHVAIPNCMSLICFDDVDWFSFYVPPITAVSNSHARLAEAATALLLNRIEKPEERNLTPVLMEISFELVSRSSTAPPRAGELVIRSQAAGELNRVASP